MFLLNKHFFFSDYPVSVDDHCQQLCHRQELWGSHDCGVGTELCESLSEASNVVK